MTQLTDEQIYGMLTLAEEQNKSIQEALERLERHEKRLDHILTQDLPRVALNALKSHLDTVNEGAKATTDAISAKILDAQANAIGEFEKAAERGKEMVDDGKYELKTAFWLRLVVTAGTLMAAAIAAVFIAAALLPSLDDIADRRATIKQLDAAGGNIDIKTCEGKTCARVMKKQCGYGDYNDYCVLDLR